jgi:rhodanese-related sulfurtransferase
MDANHSPSGRPPARRSARGVLLLAILAAACGPAGDAADGGAATIAPAELARRLSEDPPLVLDVRTPEEFASGHVPGAVNIPHTELGERLAELPGDRGGEVVVYCERGGRAARAEDLLREAGYTAVRHLEGDMAAWRRDRRPCEGC